MSIRLLARELYQAEKRLDELEARLREPALNPTEKLSLEQELRVVGAERDRLRAMLDGAKEGP